MQQTDLTSLIGGKQLIGERYAIKIFVGAKFIIGMSPSFVLNYLLLHSNLIRL